MKMENIPYKSCSGPNTYFQANPYFTNDFKPTYRKIPKPKPVEIPFKGPNKQSNVSTTILWVLSVSKNFFTHKNMQLTF